MLWKKIDVHDGRVSEVGHLIKTFPVRYPGTRTCVNEYFIGLQHFAIHDDRVRTDKAGMTANQVDVCHSREPVGNALVRRARDLVFAGFDLAHIDGNIASYGNAETSRLACQVGDPGATDQRFCRYASDVDASPTDQLALYDGGFESFLIQSIGKCRTGLAGTNNYRVIFFRHIQYPLFFDRTGRRVFPGEVGPSDATDNSIR